MPISRRSLLGSTAALAALPLITSHAAATGVSSATPDAPIIGGGLVIYSGRNEGLVGPLIEMFKTATGVDAEVRYAGTSELAATILEEGDNSPADVFFSQDAGALGALAKAGVLAKLPEDVLAKVETRFSSHDGLWIGASARARVLAYNSDNVDAATLPDSVDGLIDPIWKGKIGWAPTNASFQTFVTAFRLIKGEGAAKEWLEAMAANDVVAFDGNGPVVQAVAAGELSAGLVNHYYKYEIEKEEGAELPVINHFFAAGDVGSLVNVAGVGILATADNTDQATAFVNYLLSKEAQEYFAIETAEYPVVDGTDPAYNLPPLADLESPDIDLNDLDDLEGTLELLTDVGLI